jgi:drug/metabolite transporter (DMT)-like permease
VQVLIATLAFGIAYFFYKLGVMHGALPATMVVSQAAVFFPLATAWGWLEKRAFEPPREAWPYAASAALLLALAFILLATALVRGQASVLVPVAQMGFVITAAVGMALLGEASSARKIAGLMAAVGALVCLAAS